MEGRGLDSLLNQLELKNSGAVYFLNEEGKFDAPLHFDMHKKLELIQPTAIYVFNKQPLILFFDLTNPKDAEREYEIHKKVWSFDNAPVIFIVKENDISVFNALNYMKKERLLQEIPFETENERNEKFSFWNLQSGDTWKWLQMEYLENQSKKITQKRVNERLFQNIKDVREELKKLALPESHANSLILRLIFIRYLIDKGVEINKAYISGKTGNDRRKCFCELITQPDKLNDLFDYLDKRFNGVLFKDLDVSINNEHAKFLANVFSGELQGDDSIFKDYFFEIYDFSIIPVELISGIYESLIDEETKRHNSAIYTPPFLVEYILNDTVDKYLENAQTSGCKVFEVAVGSGIFLVQSLRRMIEKEKVINKHATNEAFSERIREIAKENLYGIDINPEALKVTCFSIYIALLDYQQPKEIDKYEFPTLIDSNLFKANFFDAGHPFNEKIQKEKPDFILGNPPWKSKKDDTLHSNWLKENNKTVGGYEIAQSFLLRVKDFMQSNTRTALIVTSTMFYNVSKTSEKFRNEFLITYCVEKFFDLSPVRRLIFEEKNSPASIVYFRLPNNADEPSKNIVNHQSLKINYFLKYFKMPVIEKFDRKEIQQKHFIDNAWMFKVALYGNVLDFVLLKKINQKGQALLDFVKKYSKGAGIMRGIKSKYPIYDDIIGKNLINNNQVTRYFSFVSEPEKVNEKESHLKSGRIRNLYEGNQILIKEQTKDESHLVISLTNEPYVFKKGVFGISSVNEKNIKSLYSALISDIYSYYIFFNAGSWATSTRPQIRWKDEYLSFPIIEPDEKTKTVLIKLVNQFIRPFQEHYAKFSLCEPKPNKKILAQINHIINDLYGIKGYEKDLIDYVLNVSRYQFQESKQHLLNFTAERNHYRNRKFVLEKYADVYLQEFGKIYTDESIQVEIYSLNHFIAMNFIFSESKPSEKYVYPKGNTEQEIFKIFSGKLSISQGVNASNPAETIFIQKDIKGFEANSFYVIKPNEYKCWHRAMAWYDVADFKEAIQKAELKRINKNSGND